MGCWTVACDLQLPLCFAPGDVEKPFVARGNEPFWRVILEPGQLVLERMDKEKVALRYEVTERSATARTFEAEGDGIRVSLKAAAQLCRDSMSGMPYPRQVRRFDIGRRGELVLSTGDGRLVRAFQATD